MNDCDNIWSVGNKVSLLILLSQSLYEFQWTHSFFHYLQFYTVAQQKCNKQIRIIDAFCEFSGSQFRKLNASRDILTKWKFTIEPKSCKFMHTDGIGSAITLLEKWKLFGTTKLNSILLTVHSCWIVDSVIVSHIVFR